MGERFRVEIERPEHGWITLWIEDEAFVISYINDFMGSLVGALTGFACRGAGEARGELEPDECVFRFQADPPLLVVSIDDLAGRSQEVLQVEASRKQLVRTFLRALHRLLHTVGRDDFQKGWGCPFPDLEPLERAFRQLPQGS